MRGSYLRKAKIEGEKMLEKVKAIAFDLDGTIYYGSKIIDGANEAISYAKSIGLKVFFLTNNSTKTRRQIYEKLTNMGVLCDYEEVYTSGYVASLYAKKERLNNIYIFGSKNLINEFHDVGIDIVDESKAENLLIGYDPDFTYESLTRALHVALKAKKIISCNKERYFPGENAICMPGCGAMVAPIEHCANRESDIIIGKPNPMMLEILCEIHSLENQEILMVGDTYESDIIMAQTKGCPSVLIGSEKYDDTTCIETIKDLVDLLK